LGQETVLMRHRSELVADENKKWAKVIKFAGIKA